MKILVLDNYDSFVYNLVHYLEEELGEPVDVRRNDEITPEEAAAYDLILLSPGPGIPSEAGIMPELLRRYAGDKVIFGVCLGHQAIGEAFGGEIINLSQVYHGLETDMHRTDESDAVLEGVPKNFRAGRYHSWVVDPASLPPELIVTALDEAGGVMAMRHRDLPVFGVQFHPESIMTEHGRLMIKNLLTFTRDHLAGKPPKP